MVASEPPEGQIPTAVVIAVGPLPGRHRLRQNTSRDKRVVRRASFAEVGPEAGEPAPRTDASIGPVHASPTARPVIRACPLIAIRSTVTEVAAGSARSDRVLAAATEVTPLGHAGAGRGRKTTST